MKSFKKKSTNILFFVGLISCVVNLLMLTGPLFMLQVYDRVLVSRSVPTLIALFSLVVFSYIILGVLDYLRVEILTRLGRKLDIQFMVPLKRISLSVSLTSEAMAQRPLKDLTFLRQFIGSPGLIAIFDLPWVPIYLAILFILHFQLGLVTTIGLLVVLSLTFGSMLLTRKRVVESSNSEFVENHQHAISTQNADSIISMGMEKGIIKKWEEARKTSLINAQSVSSITTIISSMTKSMRMILQSGILAVGAYLAIFQEITAGTIIAASILAGRALSPVDSIVGSWKYLIEAKQSYSRLKHVIEEHGTDGDVPKTQLPKIAGHLRLDSITKFPTSTTRNKNDLILDEINFSLEPGDALGVIGPSGCGKSTLARILVGISPSSSGEIKLDGARLDQWDREQLGDSIGYLPQRYNLLPGTICENIARFSHEVSDDEVISAAKSAGVHSLILDLPNGYDTEYSSNSQLLSAGQTQRLALARAIFRLPKLVVLDEPNSNLDVEGELALTQAIKQLRNAKSTSVIMAHRPSALAAVNKILMLKDGKQVAFGDKDQVLSKVTHIPSQNQMTTT